MLEKSDTLRPPAFSGLYTGAQSQRYVPLPAESRSYLTPLSRIAEGDWQQMTVNGRLLPFFRTLPDSDAPLFVKAVPLLQLDSQMDAGKIAAWAAGKGVGAVAVSSVIKAGGYAFIAYPLFDGEYYRQGDRSQLSMLARGLASLHCALEDYPEKETIAVANVQMLEKCLKTRHKLASGEWLAPYHAGQVRDLMQSWSELPHLSGVSIPLHGDTNPGNVLFTRDRTIFIDFEDAYFSFFPPEFELAYALERFLLIFGLGGPENIDAFMGEYHRRGGKIASIDRRDIINSLRLRRIIAFTRLMAFSMQKIDTAESEWRKMIALWDWLGRSHDEAWWSSPMRLPYAD